MTWTLSYRLASHFGKRMTVTLWFSLVSFGSGTNWLKERNTSVSTNHYQVFTISTSLPDQKRDQNLQCSACGLYFSWVDISIFKEIWSLLSHFKTVLQQPKCTLNIVAVNFQIPFQQYLICNGNIINCKSVWYFKNNYLEKLENSAHCWFETWIP